MGEPIRQEQAKLKKLLELYLEDELDKETYREQKAQFDLQAQRTGQSGPAEGCAAGAL